MTECACCGVPIYYNEFLGWGYAYDGRYVCSYSCMRRLRSKDLPEEMGGTEMAKERSYTLISPEQSAEIRELAQGGMGVTELARKYNVSTTTIRKHLKKGQEPETAPAPTDDPVTKGIVALAETFGSETKPTPQAAVLEEPPVAVLEELPPSTPEKLLALQLLGEVVKLIGGILGGDGR